MKKSRSLGGFLYHFRNNQRFSLSLENFQNEKYSKPAASQEKMRKKIKAKSWLRVKLHMLVFYLKSFAVVLLAFSGGICSLWIVFHLCKCKRAWVSLWHTGRLFRCHTSKKPSKVRTRPLYCMGKFIYMHPTLNPQATASENTPWGKLPHHCFLPTVCCSPLPHPFFWLCMC